MGNKDPLYAEKVAAENAKKNAANTKSFDALVAKRDKDLAILAKRYARDKAAIAAACDKGKHSADALKVAVGARKKLDAKYAEDVKAVNKALEDQRGA